MLVRHGFNVNEWVCQWPGFFVKHTCRSTPYLPLHHLSKCRPREKRRKSENSDASRFRCKPCISTKIELSCSNLSSAQKHPHGSERSRWLWWSQRSALPRTTDLHCHEDATTDPHDPLSLPSPLQTWHYLLSRSFSTVS